MTITRLQPGKRMSQAVKHGNTVYFAGQVAVDHNGTIEKQTTEVLAAIDKLLAEEPFIQHKVLEYTRLTEINPLHCHESVKSWFGL